MRLFVIVILLLLLGPVKGQDLSTKSTRKTKNLYHFLGQSSKSGVLFGHQDDLAYGVGWKNQLGNSDVKLVTGKYPAIFGWELGKIQQTHNVDSVAFDEILEGIKYAYKMGGINTVSWHADHPITGNNAWDKQPAVKQILPGGSNHANFINQLNLLANFLKECRVGFHKIPIVLRPFHEHNGDWFWWGKPYCTEEEFIALWRFTIDYLRNEKKINHLIIAYSPDRSRLDLKNGEAEYLYGYPGDEYVDIIGLDDYWDVGHQYNNIPSGQQKEHLAQSIALICQIATKKNKIAALTESGKAGLDSENWFTESLLEPIKLTNGTSGIAWLLVWRNASMEYFYVPYKGHHSEKDFRRFESDPMTLFLDDIKNPYKK